MAYVPPRGPPTPQPPPDAGLPHHLHPPPPFPGGPPPHHFPPHHMHGPPPPPPHGHGPYGAPPPPHAGHGPPPPHHHMHSGPFGAPPHRPPPPPHGHVPPPGHGPPPPPFEAGFGPPHHPPPAFPPFRHEQPHYPQMPTTPGDNTAPYHPPPPHHAFAGDGDVPRPPPPQGGPRMGIGGPPDMFMPRGPSRHPAPHIEAPHADPSSYPAKAFTRGLDGQSSPEVVGVDATTGGPKPMRARVELKQDENMLYVLSNGVPNYQPRSSSGEDLTTDWTRVGQARGGRPDFNQGAIIEQEHVFYFPLRPQDTGSSWKALYDVTAAGGGPPPRGPPGMMGRQQPMWTPMGPIGVAINGVPLFNQYSAILDDAVETESFDVCCGHPVPGIGAYHYHQFPKCVRGSRALGVNTTDDRRLGADTPTATTTTASTHSPPSSLSPSTPAGPSTIPTASAAASTIPTASGSAVQAPAEDIPVAQAATSSDITTTEITMDPTPVPGVVVTSPALPPATVVTTEKEGGGTLQAATAGSGDVSDTTPSRTTQAELLAEEAAVAAALLDLVAQGNGHSAIVGYSFDGYPIYGPVGWGPKGSAKVMTSSYQRTGEDHKFVEGSGNLDVCNGISGPTPEYPEGVYHYHCTVDAAALQTGRVVATYPYVIGRYRGVPDVRNFPPFLLDMPGASSAQQGQRR